MGWFTKWLGNQPPLVAAEDVQESCDVSMADKFAQQSIDARQSLIDGHRTQILAGIEAAARAGRNHYSLFELPYSKDEDVRRERGYLFATLDYFRARGFRVVKNGFFVVDIRWGPVQKDEEPFNGNEPPAMATPAKSNDDVLKDWQEDKPDNFTAARDSVSSLVQSSLKAHAAARQDQAKRDKLK